jgi:hypothetical protein
VLATIGGPIPRGRGHGEPDHARLQHAIVHAVHHLKIHVARQAFLGRDFCEMPLRDKQ